MGKMNLGAKLGEAFLHDNLRLIPTCSATLTRLLGQAGVNRSGGAGTQIPPPSGFRWADQPNSPHLQLCLSGNVLSSLQPTQDGKAFLRFS